MRGAASMTSRIQTAAKKQPDRIARAMYQEAQIEATEMKRRTPVDIRENAPHPGNLRNSIHVELPEKHGRSIVVVIATGAQAPYAIWVHELLDNVHPVGEAKFMESVINESRQFMAARLAQRVHFNQMK